MGYDVTVTKTEFHRWFSIWNWHRCIAISLYGLGIIDDDEIERQLMLTTNLQHHDQPMDPKDESKYQLRLQEIEEKVGEITDANKRIIETHHDYDDKGRLIGGRAMIPMTPEEMESMGGQEKVSEMVFSTIRMQAETNTILFDNQEELEFDNETCRLLSTMEGIPIDPLPCAMFGTGAMIGLELLMKSGENPTDLIKIFGTLFEPEKATEEDKEKMNFFRKLIERARDRDPQFELTELWAEDEIGSIASFVGVMMEAVLTKSTIKIT